MPTVDFYPTLDGYIVYRNGVFFAVYPSYNYFTAGERYTYVFPPPNWYQWFRAFLRFDFSAIPATAIINSATFYAYYYAYEHSRLPFVEGLCELTHIEDIGATLDASDWSKGVLHDYGTFVGLTESLGWYSKDVTSSFSSPYGFLSYRLKDSIEDDDPTYWTWYFWATEKGSLIPYVRVDYSLPKSRILTDGLGVLTQRIYG